MIKVKDVKPEFYDAEKFMLISKQIMQDELVAYTEEKEIHIPIIGTLKEKTLHKMLKYYYEPDKNFHEIKTKGYVADINRDNNITEIQTGNFRAASEKIKRYLEDNDLNVTFVYPIGAVKSLCWIDKQTKQASIMKRSPKFYDIYEFYDEIYWIKDFIGNEKFKLKIILLEINEFKYLDGWGKTRKNNATKIDRLPIAAIREVDFIKKQDYIKFIPPKLVEQGNFTSKELKSESGKKDIPLHSMISVAKETGLIKQSGKKRNAFIYEIVFE